MKNIKLLFISLLLLTVSFSCAANSVVNDTPRSRLKAEIDHLISDPAFGSVKAMAVITSPVVQPGSHCCLTSGSA